MIVGIFVDEDVLDPVQVPPWIYLAMRFCYMLLIIFLTTDETSYVLPMELYELHQQYMALQL